MAKKDKAAKSAKAGKIPKSIGGVKLSKTMRKSGEALIAKAQTPQGRQVIAAGLAMASRWAWLRRGSSRPLLVLLTSSAAEASGEVVPIPTAPVWAWAS